MDINNMIQAEYYPAIPREEIARLSKQSYALKDFSSLGSGLAVTAGALLKAAMNAPSNEGLYRCVFPEGVAGHLAAFKDGSGLIGTIVNDHGIAAQARWLPAEGGAAFIPFDPVTLAIGAALMSINQKLDQIMEVQEEILRFLQQDKESELEGTVNSLADILEQYKYNSENDLWKSGKLTVVTTYKGKAEGNIIFYRKELSNAFEKQKLFHGNQAANKLKAKLENDLKYYQLSVYITAYASFLEIILSGNYGADYLDHMSEKIREYDYQYRVDYSKCYEQLESYMKDTIQTKTFSGLGKVSEAAGKAIAKIPYISRGTVDEALIEAGSKIQEFSQQYGENALQNFGDNRDAGIQMFLQNIDTIDEMCNRPVELFFDREKVYICA